MYWNFDACCAAMVRQQSASIIFTNVCCGFSPEATKPLVSIRSPLVNSTPHGATTVNENGSWLSSRAHRSAMLTNIGHQRVGEASRTAQAHLGHVAAGQQRGN